MKRKLLSILLVLVLTLSLGLAACGGGVKLASIAISEQPTKVTYYVGETFDTAGMVVNGVYSDGSVKAVTGYTVSPSDALKLGTAKVTVSYTEGDVTATASVTITVKPASSQLKSIAVTTQPTKTTYKVGDTFAAAGMVVTATYGDNSTKPVTTYTYSPNGALALGNTVITVSFTNDGIIKEATVNITVTEDNNALTAIGIAKAPTKVIYREGESFNNAGMKVLADYEDGTSEEVTNYTVTPATLAITDTFVTISYTEGSVTQTCKQNITVNAAGIDLTRNIVDEDEWIDDNFIDQSTGNENKGIKVYKLSEGENALSTIETLEKFSDFDAMHKDVGHLDLKDYTHLYINAHSDLLGAKLIVKIASIPEIPGGRGFSEIVCPLLTEPSTFVFKLDFEGYERVRAGIKQIFIFPNAEASGEDLPNIYVNDLVFLKGDIQDETTIANTGAPKIPEPSNYDGVSPTFDINRNFVDHDNAFDIDWSVGTTTVSVKAGGKTAAWAYLNSPVTGNLKAFTKLTIVYKGTPGTSFKIKLEGGGATATETTHEPEKNPTLALDPTCDGTVQTYEWTGFTAANLTAGQQQMVLIFFMPDKLGGEFNSLEIYKFEFSK